jgi:pyruvate dehydrogenase E1 component alpha subunit
MPQDTVASVASTELNITADEALILYEDMVLGRYFEDKCAEMYYRGKMFGFVHLYNGQEAVSTGVIKAMRKDDYVCSTYRDHVHALSSGVTANEVMAELFGKETGCSKGRGGSMHMFSAKNNFLGGYAFVSEGIPVASGAAFQSKYRREVMGDPNADQVTACFFGDGASNNGQFFETLNNNNWAIGMLHERATSDVRIHRKAEAFGMPGYEVDGMDVLAVRQRAQEAIARGRAGEGPTVLECMTYRFRGHSLADPDELRPREEKDKWFGRDPIKILAGRILDAGLVTEAQLKEIRQRIQATVEESVRFAEASPEPDPKDLYRYQFAEDE